MTRKQLSHIRH